MTFLPFRSSQRSPHFIWNSYISLCSFCSLHHTAGLAVGLWKDLNELTKLRVIQETYTPIMKEHERAKYWKGWKKAVDRSLNWVDDDDAPLVQGNKTTNTAVPVLAALGIAFGVGFLVGQNRKV